MAKKVWQPSFNKEQVKLLQENISLDNKIITISEQTLQHKLFSGEYTKPIHRIIVKRLPASCVLLYHPESQQVILIEQFRHTCMETDKSPWLLEAVAGLVEANETPEQAAIREAKEEAGCNVSHLTKICDYLPSCGISNEITHTFCGKVDELPNKINHGAASECEDTKIHFFNRQEIKELLKSQELLAANAYITLQWFLLNFDEVHNSFTSP